MGIGDWGLGIGDWGLGIGDWAQGNLFDAPCPMPHAPYFGFAQYKCPMLIRRQ
ncbi:MAG: hypothetical protein KA716_08070 [Gloeotrichia echinulata DEX184]|nr:hypothetical protein [Gloeotrichia echinulata DEX184]